MSGKFGILALAAVTGLGGLVLGRNVPQSNVIPPSETAPPLYSGEVTAVYWSDINGESEGYTSAGKGIAITNYVNVEARVTVYPNWIAVERSPRGPLRYIPRDRVISIRFASTVQSADAVDGGDTDGIEAADVEGSMKEAQ